jgi:type II secretory pathway component PulF
MNHFEYSAQSKGGAAITGIFESRNSADAMEELESMGLLNIDLRAVNSPPAQRSLGSDEFIFFNEQLASLANAGICLDEGLRQLGKDVRSGRLRNVLEAMANDIERGKSLPEALEGHASLMPPLYARVVRAGVQSGHLPATLLNLSSHLRLVAETRRLLAEALPYPATVLVLAIVLFCGIVMFVVPQFADIFNDFEVRLPPLTMMMIALSQALPRLLLAALLIALVLWFVLRLLRRSAGGRLWRERFILQTPIVGSLIRNSLQARFLRSMAFAIDAAVPLPEALRLSGGSTGSPTLMRDAEIVAAELEKAVPVEQACRRASLIPAMFGYFMALKGDSANLREGLIQLSKACEARAAHSQSMLRGWMAPMAVFVVGVAIGLLILALFMPLVGLVQSVSGG